MKFKKSQSLYDHVQLSKMTEEELINIFGHPTKQTHQIQQYEVQKLKRNKEPSKSVFIPSLMAQGYKKKHFLQFLVIRIDNSIKNTCTYIYVCYLYKGDIMMLFVIVYNCTTLCYYIMFDEKIDELVILDIVVEIFFGIDMLMRFLHEYRDHVSLEIVTDIGSVTKRYLKGWFIIDFVAILPLDRAVGGGGQIKLLRVLRLPKFLRFLEISKMDELLESIMERFCSKQKMVHLFIARYIYKIVRFILVAILLTYFIGCVWYFIIVSSWNEEDERDSFYEIYQMSDYSSFRNLIMCCYFVMTTLTTVGYGDLTPKTKIERVFGTIIMIIGIAFFSYIMGNFSDVLASYHDKIGNSTRNGEMQRWMTSLTKFNNKSLPQSLVTKIDEYFNYFWQNDRLQGLTKEDKYIKSIPQGLKEEVKSQNRQNINLQLLCFIFDDIFEIFRGFFHLAEFKEKCFYYDIGFILLPRKFEPQEIILNQEEIVEEIILILEGEVQIGFTYQDEEIVRVYSKGYYFGDYNIFSGTNSQYQYRAISNVKALVIPKYQFLLLLENYPEYRSRMCSYAYQNNRHTKRMMIRQLRQHLIDHFRNLDRRELYQVFNKHAQGKSRWMRHKMFKLTQLDMQDRNENEIRQSFQLLSKRAQLTGAKIQTIKQLLIEKMDRIQVALKKIKQELEDN